MRSIIAKNPKWSWKRLITAAHNRSCGCLTQEVLNLILSDDDEADSDGELAEPESWKR